MHNGGSGCYYVITRFSSLVFVLISFNFFKTYLNYLFKFISY